MRITDVNTKDIHEAMELSGHNFEVETVPLCTIGHGNVKVTDKVGVIRKGDGAYLGTAGHWTRHIQPIDLYGMAEELIKHTDAVITKCLTMDQGAVIGINFELKGVDFLSQDPTTHNLLLLTSYNSRFAILCRVFNLREACLNILAICKRIFTIKNTTHNLPRLATATKMLKYYGKEVEKFDEQMKLLVNTPMSVEESLDWFGNAILNPPARESKRANTIYDSALDKFLAVYKDGMGVNISGISGTAYKTLNVATEYFNHHMPTRVREGKTEDEVRFSSTILGGNADNQMQKCFSSLVDIAQHKLITV